MEDLQTKENKQQKRLMKAVDHALRAVEAALKDMVSAQESCRKPDMKALKDATAILKELMGMIRELYGISAPRQEDRTIQVVFAAGEDSWKDKRDNLQFYRVGRGPAPAAPLHQPAGESPGPTIHLYRCGR